MAETVIPTIEEIITDAGGTVTEHPETVIEALEMLDGSIGTLKDKVDHLNGAYVYRGTVQTEQQLPTSGQVAGDVYNIVAASSYGAAGQNVAWNGSGWDSLGSTLTVSPATAQSDGLMSTEDFSKLAGIEPEAERNDIATVKVNGTSLVPDANRAVDVTVASPSSSDPVVDGTASAGSSTNYARADHVHPTDTSREQSGLGITGASVGQVVAVKAVDASGKPTSFEPTDGADATTWVQDGDDERLAFTYTD